MKTPEELAEKFIAKWAPTEPSWVDYDLSKKAYLAGYREANRWIPVSEELPPVGEFCLVKLNIRNEPSIQFAKRLEDSTKVWFHTHRAIWCGLESITHWMPLPPSPNTEEQ